MPPRPLSVVVGIMVWLGAPALSARNITTPELLAAMQQPHELARYRYLVKGMPQLSGPDAGLAQQFLAFCENEMGLYSEAVRDFPLRSRLPADLQLPRPPRWQAADALDTIEELAADRRIVMVNEAHHDAHTRALTLALLPRLRALGFTHLAIEALDGRDTELQRRGYPTLASGSEYLHEPVYGEIVRAAIRLGFVIVAYDEPGSSPQEREDLQARNLYRRVLAGNPKARLLVHAGYAHIDKAPGRLGRVHPMAERLQKLAGSEVLSIDQTDIREDLPSTEHEAYLRVLGALRAYHPIVTGPVRPVDTRQPVDSAYHQLIGLYAPQAPIVLRHADTGAPWSARPGVYDLSVILPVANRNASDYTEKDLVSLRFDGRDYAVLPPAAGGHRPGWLALAGTRVPYPVDADLCMTVFPCLVEAHYSGETEDAVAADRYLFLKRGARNQLWLRPGAYRLRSLDANGKVLAQATINVAPAAQR
ncbi:hypothetical protein [Fulvimonas yonginensis]|uniref:Erythromycin esterase n=1 Tax=Fulvimonas yonginensis TaxID=1495200 RepID=A0ABU8JFH0_9GAMM